LADLDLAREMGAHARQTVAEKFPLSAFTEHWRTALFEAAERRPKPRWRPRPRAARRTKLLLHYVASPLTTGRYLEQSLLRAHDVLTAGLRLPEAVLRMWGFKGDIPPYPPHRIDLPYRASYQELRAKLPRGFQPRLYWWIDSGSSQVEADIGLLDMPRIAYLIDTHVSPDLRIEMARHFDCTFLAHRGQVETFRQAGIRNVSWVPLACHPPLHQTGALERIYDVAYVGSFSNEEGQRRRTLLQAIQEHFPNSKIGRYWPAAMARIYAQSRIVVNACHNRDVNMRVFEAMAAGALLITDEAEGLEDLFEDGVHLVIYRNDNELRDLVTHYLEDHQARERIAGSGQQLVLQQHTYAHRTAEILKRTREALGHAPKLGRSQKPKEADYYGSVRREVIQHVPLQARRVLDVGCGAGAFGRALKEERGVQEVVGIEIVEEAWQRANEVLDQAILGNVEDMDFPFDDGYFDCIVCADVIEHLVEPGETLRRLRRLLAQEGVIVFSVPNVRFHEVIAMLSRGAWTYLDSGICDSTHLRFFTRTELSHLVEEAGLEVAEMGPLHIADSSQCPRNPDGSVTMGKLTLAHVSDAEYEELLAFQYAVIACKPGLDRLTPARQALEARKDEAAYALAVDAVGVDEAERRHIMGKALARLGQLEKAEHEYLKSLELRRNPETAGEYGILLVGMNRSSEAKPYLHQALREHPPNHDRIEGALGLVALSEQHCDAAYTLLASALDASFEHSALLKPFTEVADALGRLDEAEPILNRFAEFYPGDFELACDHADVLAKLQRFSEARQRLEDILGFAPGHARARQLLETLAQEDR